MKIAIAGYGFVGKAYEKFIIDKVSGCSLTISDPAYKDHSQGIPNNTEAVIVCVATPQKDDGSCQMRHVKEVIKESPNVPILIKSTICLEGWREIRSLFPDRNISFSPEFLRQDSWVEDVDSMESILVGGDDFSFWSDVFKMIECVDSDPEALIMTKCAKNNFLALKVSFFNQLYDLCNKMGVNYDEVRRHTTADPRIGESHSFVTEERGFGGHCFPKDTSALIRTSEKYGKFFSLMHEARSYNKSIRRD
jgi:UDPglucose 6-dehydrogenase